MQRKIILLCILSGHFILIISHDAIERMKMKMLDEVKKCNNENEFDVFIKLKKFEYYPMAVTAQQESNIQQRG